MRVVWRAIRRFHIRKLYNSNQWNKAQHLSRQYLMCDNDQQFHRDIVLRSLWNLGLYDEMIGFALAYPSKLSDKYIENAKSRLGHGVDPLPSFHESISWDKENLLENWYQEGDIVWLRHPWGWTHWAMPPGFKIQKTHKSLLELAMHVLLRPWVKQIDNIKTERRDYGEKLALSYSGGTDSAAAAILLPDDTILSYHERSFPSMLRHELPHRLFNFLHEKLGREVLCISSNHERIRTFHGKANGFSTDYAAGVHLILLADFLNLKGIAFGTPIDNTWLKKGRKFRDFSESWHWIHWREKFAHAGLDLELPINHISEAGAMKICQQSVLSEYINSCLRGVGGSGCQRCWKCFHKNGPLGRPMDPKSIEIQTFLNKKPLRTAQHALWAIQVQELEHLAPHLSDELQESLEWWEQAYRPGIALISEPWRKTVERRTEQMMSYMPAPIKLHQVDLFPEMWD